MQVAAGGGYRPVPFSVANALAGLPYIGWRQSMKRCAEWRLQDLGSGQYLVVETISSLVSSCERRSKVIDIAEGWLRERLPKKSRATLELAEDWYYLKAALRIVSTDKEISRKHLPYRIGQVFQQMRTHPTAADLLLAEESQIRP